MNRRGSIYTASLLLLTAALACGSPAPVPPAPPSGTSAPPVATSAPVPYSSGDSKGPMYVPVDVQGCTRSSDGKFYAHTAAINYPQPPQPGQKVQIRIYVDGKLTELSLYPAPVWELGSFPEGTRVGDGYDAWECKDTAAQQPTEPTYTPSAPDSNDGNDGNGGGNGDGSGTQPTPEKAGGDAQATPGNPSP